MYLALYNFLNIYIVSSSNVHKWIKMAIIEPSELGQQNIVIIIFKYYQYIHHKLHVYKSYIYISRILLFFLSYIISVKLYRVQKLSVALTKSDFYILDRHT